jgi:hypothetical protein
MMMMDIKFSAVHTRATCELRTATSVLSAGSMKCTPGRHHPCHHGPLPYSVLAMTAEGNTYQHRSHPLHRWKCGHRKSRGLPPLCKILTRRGAEVRPAWKQPSRGLHIVKAWRMRGAPRRCMEATVPLMHQQPKTLKRRM